MRRYLTAYALWLAGVLSAAAVAYLFYRRVLVIGAEELELELNRSARRRTGGGSLEADAGAITGDDSASGAPAI